MGAACAKLKNQTLPLKAEVKDGNGYIAKAAMTSYISFEVKADDLKFLDNTTAFTISFFCHVVEPKNENEWFILFARSKDHYQGKTPTIGYYKKDIWVYTTGGHVKGFNGCLKYGKKCQFAMVMRPGEIELFVDGQSIGTKQEDWKWINNEPIRFGSCAGYKPAEGLVEEIHFCGKALSDGEIKANYQAQKTKLGIKE